MLERTYQSRCCGNLLPEAELGRANVLDVGQRPGLEVVDADDPMAAAQELVAQMRAQEAGATGDKTGGHECEGEVAATPAQATALELLEQLAGGDEDHEGHDH